MLRDSNVRGKFSFTSLVTFTVTNPPGVKQGFFVHVILVAGEPPRELRSCEVIPAANFAARVPTVSLLDVTNARAAVRAETSVER